MSTAGAAHRNGQMHIEEARARFRRWRHSRPFWAGFFTLLCGLMVVFPPFASLQIADITVSLHTIGGAGSLVVGVVLLICGFALWFQPHYRVPAGIVTLLLALVALIVANLGVLLVGTIIGIIGGCLALSWRTKSRH